MIQLLTSQSSEEVTTGTGSLSRTWKRYRFRTNHEVPNIEELSDGCHTQAWRVRESSLPYAAGRFPVSYPISGAFRQETSRLRRNAVLERGR